MDNKMITEADVRKLLSADENKALDEAFESDAWHLSRGADACPSMWLMGAMYWDATPQGHDYWNGIYMRLCKEHPTTSAEGETR